MTGPEKPKLVLKTSSKVCIDMMLEGITNQGIDIAEMLALLYFRVDIPLDSCLLLFYTWFYPLRRLWRFQMSKLVSIPKLPGEENCLHIPYSKRFRYLTCTKLCQINFVSIRSWSLGKTLELVLSWKWRWRCKSTCKMIYRFRALDLAKVFGLISKFQWFFLLFPYTAFQ